MEHMVGPDGMHCAIHMTPKLVSAHIPFVNHTTPLKIQIRFKIRRRTALICI